MTKSKIVSLLVVSRICFRCFALQKLNCPNIWNYLDPDYLDPVCMSKFGFCPLSLTN